MEIFGGGGVKGFARGSRPEPLPDLDRKLRKEDLGGGGTG